MPSVVEPVDTIVFAERILSHLSPPTRRRGRLAPAMTSSASGSAMTPSSETACPMFFVFGHVSEKRLFWSAKIRTSSTRPRSVPFRASRYCRRRPCRCILEGFFFPSRLGGRRDQALRAGAPPRRRRAASRPTSGPRRSRRDRREAISSVSEEATEDGHAVGGEAPEGARDVGAGADVHTLGRLREQEHATAAGRRASGRRRASGGCRRSTAPAGASMRAPRTSSASCAWRYTARSARARWRRTACTGRARACTRLSRRRHLREQAVALAVAAHVVDAEADCAERGERGENGFPFELRLDVPAQAVQRVQELELRARRHAEEADDLAAAERHGAVPLGLEHARPRASTPCGRRPSARCRARAPPRARPP